MSDPSGSDKIVSSPPLRSLKKKIYRESPYIWTIYIICLHCTISLKMTIFMENFFCLGDHEYWLKGGLKAKQKVGGTYSSTFPCLALPELQGKVLFGPSQNPNPDSSRTGKESSVVKQKRNLFSQYFLWQICAKIRISKIKI